MNLLAHLWLADASRTSVAGQIFGDIVKGRMDCDAPRFNTAVDRGIRLHRHIDSRCDDHPIHRAMRRRFAPPLRRYAGIIVDIGFDHALARCWSSFSTETLPAFAERIAERVAREWPEDAPLTAPVPAHLAALLAGYIDVAGIERALRAVSARLRRTNPLAHALPDLLAEYDGFAHGLAPLLIALQSEMGIAEPNRFTHVQ